MAVGKREVRDLLGRPDAVLLDARVAERFRGDQEPNDARPGHIPGARNAPHPGNLVEPGGAFRSPEELRARYAALGVADGKKVVAYCGSGVTACHTLLDGPTRDGLAEAAYRAVRRQQARDCREQRGLARAVRADDGDDRGRGDMQRNVTHGEHLAVRYG
jgi:thiosulfate/3-mercaptopyruvate sulfurtransferase